MKDLINPKLDLSTLKNTFKDKGYVVIDNYLKEDVAEKLHNFFSYEMPSDWWSVATYPSLENYDKVSYYRNTPEESENIKLARRYAEQEFGLNNLCIGVPVILGKNGIEKIVEIDLSDEELEQMMDTRMQMKHKRI